MGLFKKAPSQSSNTAVPEPLLNAVEPPVEVIRGFARPDQSTLMLKSKIMHVKEDIYMVEDQHGADVVQISGGPFAFKVYKTISTPSGHLLFRMRNKRAAFRRTLICEDEHGSELFKLARIWAWRIKVQLRIPSTVGDSMTLVLVGSHGGRRAEVIRSDNLEVVAQMRSQSWRHAKENRQCGICTVAPGVDLTLITALYLAWERCKSDDAAAAASAHG